MKKIGVICLVFCLVVSFLGVISFATPVENSEPTGDKHEEAVGNAQDTSGLDAAAPLLGGQQLVENIKSAILYECASDTLIYAYNPDAQMYPSSFVKILTALLAIEKGKLDDAVTATEEVLASVPYDAVSADLQAGEVMTLEQLIYCMMVGSANDASAVIAHHISGSQEVFVQEMNDYAAQLGCTNTQFMNVHGLHHEQQYTTARDMAKILREAMKNEAFVEIFSAVAYEVPATNKSDIRDLATGNYMMKTDSIYYDARVTGGRTGVAEDGTRCLATSAEGNGLKLVSIVMGAESVEEEDGYTLQVIGGYQETSTLFDKGLDGYKAVQVLFPEQAVTQSSVIDGENHVVLGTKVAVSAVLPSNVGVEDLTFRYSNIAEIKAPITEGDLLSKVEVWYGATCVAKGDLYAMNAVRSVLDIQTVVEETNDGVAAKTALTVIAWVVGGCVVLVVAVRFLPTLRKILTKHRIKRYRRGRRRSR